MSTEMTVGEQVAMKRQIMDTEVDLQVSTAKRFPRELGKVLETAENMALKSQEIAASCFYVLPRGGRTIEGPSVRLAEIIKSCWGNLRCQMRAGAIGEKTVTAEATVWDMENNILMNEEAVRKITDRKGKRYNDDMVIMTMNAAKSIALRNALFRVIPRSVVDEIYRKAKSAAVGTSKTLDERRRACVDSYLKMGFAEEDIPKIAGVNSIEEVGLKELEKLLGMFTSLRDGDIDKDFVMDLINPPEEEEETTEKKKGSKGDDLTEKLKGKKSKQEKLV